MRLLGGFFAAFATFVLGVLGDRVRDAGNTDVLDGANKEYDPFGDYGDPQGFNYRTHQFDAGMDPTGWYAKWPDD